MNLDIPPGRETVTAPPSVCPAECTRQFPHPLTLVANGFHMHQIGKSIRTQRFRGGKEMASLGVRRCEAYYRRCLQSSALRSPRR